MFNIMLAITFILLSGCATVDPQRTVFTNLPPLEKGWARVSIGSGQLVGMVNIDLKFRTQVGPVYIDGNSVGSVAKNEHIVVDLLPGNYELNWLPHEPYKIFSEKTTLKILPGDNRQFACDMKQKGGGAFFGAIGVLASDYIYSGYLSEKPISSSSRLVSYMKFKKP